VNGEKQAGQPDAGGAANLAFDKETALDGQCLGS
jgi:hypothetical protein